MYISTFERSFKSLLRILSYCHFISEKIKHQHNKKFATKKREWISWLEKKIQIMGVFINHIFY